MMAGGAVLRRLLSGVALTVVAAQSAAAGTLDQQSLPVADRVQGIALASSVAAAQAPGTILQLPLIRSGRPYADISAEVFADGRIRYERESLIEGLGRMMAPEHRARFVASLAAGPLVSPEDVQQAGVLLRYDPALLEVVVEAIDPSLAPLEIIGGPFTRSEIPVTLLPERFSAYLNVIGDLRLLDFEEFEDPGVIVFGAMRFDNVVLEFDGGYDPSLTGGSGFYRRQARAVYDEPDKARRWSAGDLQLFSSNILGGVLLGGVGVERGRRIFTGMVPVQPLGPQQVLIERDATVEVMVDGQQAETLQLMAGPYDLAGLLARYGGRDVQLFVTDVTGRRQLTGIDTFFDPIDLAFGEDEYSFGVGWVAQDFRAQPIYRGKPAFSGFYRRGITNRLILGAAVQVSEEVQVGAIEIVASPGGIPGRFELSGALSTGDDTGMALRGAYSVQMGRGPWARQFSISADYRSGGFATLADQLGFRRFETLNATASFAQGLGERTTLVTGLNWFDRENLPTTRRAFADVVHRARNFRITAGVEYGRGQAERDFGVRVAISVPFGPRTRAEAGYNSRREDFRAFVARSYDDRVGSFGYDLGLRRAPGSASVDGSAHYVGNRFFSRLTVSTAGPGFSDIDERQFARLQVGTSFAYAGGSFARGRPPARGRPLGRPPAPRARGPGGAGGARPPPARAGAGGGRPPRPITWP
jgi:outer membrane usher protein